MATDPMASAWQKYHWASKHMDAVAAAPERSVDPNAHPIAFDINLEPAHGNIAVVRVISRTQPGRSRKPSGGSTTVPSPM
jgi:hypothetical protein